MSFNSKQKSLANYQTQNSSPKDKKYGKRKKMIKVHLGLMPVVLSLSNHVDPYILAWGSLTAQDNNLFQDSKELNRIKRSQCSRRGCPH